MVLMGLASGFVLLAAPAVAAADPEPSEWKESSTPAAASSPVTRDMSQETADSPRVASIGRLHNYLGLVAGLGLSSRRYGGPAGELGRLAAATGLGGVQARLAGYADRHPVGARVVRMTMPELMLVLEIGGTSARRDEVAAREGHGPGRSGVAAGASGLANIGVGFASPGKVGVYAKVFVGQRFSARSNTDLEGAYFIASAGPSFGLRVAIARRFTMLLGGGVDGVLGVQRLNRSRLVAQLAPIVDLGIYALARPRVYLGLVARGDVGVLGERYGGRRLHGRAAAEVVWKLEGAGPARFAALLLAYDGSRVDGAAGHPQFAAVAERRVGHQLMLSGGVTF
jgi:hypothetical protein